MSSVKKEARLSGILLARKGSALPAHTDHKLTMQAVEECQNQSEAQSARQEIKTDQLDHSLLVEAVKEINDVTKRQYNKVVSEVASQNYIEPEVEHEVRVKVSDRKISQLVNNDLKPASNKEQAGKRIAMTLRMERDEHLKLRLHAAHSRKSCQDIISAALDMYLSEDEKYVV